MIPYSVVSDAVKVGKKTSKGATGAILITIKGQRMIYKPNTMGRVVNEYIAYQLYAAAGARVPQSYLVMNVNVESGTAIPMAILTEFLEKSLTVRQVLQRGIPIPQEPNAPRRKTLKRGAGSSHMIWGKSLRELEKEKRNTAKAEGRIGFIPLKIGEQSLLRYALRSDFVYHALFLNWDSKNADNHLVVPEPPKPIVSSESSEGSRWSLLSYNDNSSSGSRTNSVKKPVMPSYDFDHPYVIDLGGALFYRAMGETKSKRFLLEDELLELINIPGASSHTSLKLYDELRNERTMRSMVCKTAATIDSEKVMAVVENMRPLFKFLPIGADLPALIGGRLNALRAFCEGRYNLEDVMAQARNVEYKMSRGEGPIDLRRVRPRNMPAMRKEAAAEALVRKRYPIVTASMAEEAVLPLRMRGKRTMAAETGAPVTREEMALVVLNKDWVAPIDPEIDGIYPENISENSNTTTTTTTTDKDKGLYPSTRFTIIQNETPLARSLRSKVVAMPEDPAIAEWLHRQVEYIEGLTPREFNILTSYTRNGDIIVNEYLRRRLVGDLTGLIQAMIRVDTTYPDRPVALGYSLYDQYPELVRSGKITAPVGLGRKADLLIPSEGSRDSRSSGSSEEFLDMDLLRDIIEHNIEFFGRAENILPLVEQYYKELQAIIEKAPRAPHAFRVFRGIKSENHLSGLTFETVDFLSTSLAPDKAVVSFTNVMTDPERLVTRTYHCCLYEIDVSPAVPCIYMQPVSQFSDEFEVLLAPGVAVTLESTVHLKRFIDPARSVTPAKLGKRELFEQLESKYGGTMVSVVEGIIGKAARKAVGLSRGLLEKGSLEDMAFVAAPRWSGTAERFAAQKPRTQVVGRNRTRRLKKRQLTRKNNTGTE